MKKRFFRAISLFFVLIPCTLFAQEYPNYIGHVNDFANVISSEYNDKLTNLASELEQKTGAELAIATVKTISPQSIDMYGVGLFTKWGIGKKGKDNGVLIVMALEERKVFIAPGYGLEGILPDGVCGEIYRSILRPNFKEGEFGKGLFLASSEIANRIAKEQGVSITGSEQATGMGKDNNFPREIIGFFFFLFIVAFIIRIFGIWGLLFLPRGRGGYWTGGTSGGRGGFSGGSGGFGGFGGGSCGGGGAGGGW